MAYRNGPKIITDGLVLCLDAAISKSYPGSGTVWKDLSGNGNNGTLVNGPTFSSDNCGSLVFDGVNDYTNLGTQSNLTNITNVTACGWSKGNSGQIINRYYSTTAHNGWLLGIGNIGGRKNSSAYIDVPSGYSPTTTEWVYTVGVISEDIWSVYVNGVLMNSINAGYGSTVFANNIMYMGSIPQFSAFYAIAISQTLIYNRALSAQEIQQNYKATKGRFGL